MKTKLEACISVCVYILLTGTTAASAIGSSSAGDVSTRDLMGSLSLTRDVPMLRLGRTAAADDAQASSIRETRERLRAMIRDFLESQMLRDETRRQPPLPRYGRRSVPLSRRNSGGNQDSSFFPFQFTAEEDPVYRSPPRGGRYKRSAATNAGQQGYNGEIMALYLSPFESQRISHYLQEKLHDRQEKAVPYPRIGRDQGSALGNSKQMASIPGPLAAA